MKKENKKTGNIKITYNIKPFQEKPFTVKLEENMFEDTSVMEMFDWVFDFFENIFGSAILREYFYYRNDYSDLDKIDTMLLKTKPKNKHVEDLIANPTFVKSIKEEILQNDNLFNEVLVSYLNYNYRKPGVKNGK